MTDNQPHDPTGADAPAPAEPEPPAELPPVQQQPPAYVLPQVAPPGAPRGDDLVETLIPWKNSDALWAYYLAVFSIIPCLGIPLGIAAFFFGRRGLAFAREHPEAHGRTHAWVGVLVGGFFGFCYLIGTVALIVLAIVNR